MRERSPRARAAHWHHAQSDEESSKEEVWRHNCMAIDFSAKLAVNIHSLVPVAKY